MFQNVKADNQGEGVVAKGKGGLKIMDVEGDVGRAVFYCSQIIHVRLVNVEVSQERQRDEAKGARDNCVRPARAQIEESQFTYGGVREVAWQLRQGQVYPCPLYQMDMFVW
jgi:hypothetical protein